MLVVEVSINGRRVCIASTRDVDIVAIWLQDMAAHGTTFQVRGFNNDDNKALDWLSTELKNHEVDITISILKDELSDIVSDAEEGEYQPIESAKDIISTLTDNTWKRRFSNDKGEAQKVNSVVYSTHYFEVCKNGEYKFTGGGPKYDSCQAVLSIKPIGTNQLKVSAFEENTGETALWEEVDLNVGDTINISLLVEGQTDKPCEIITEGLKH